VGSWWAIPALVGAAVIFAAIDGDSGLRNWWRLRADLDEARARIALLREEVGSRRDAAHSLERDEFAIERAIRERLEYVRPGETLVKLRSGEDASSRFH
jgi:cell division protein FtsB